MRTVRAQQVFAALLADAEAHWYDTDHWAEWVDGLQSVLVVEGDWPRAGASVSWQSGPAGRGSVLERVLEHEPLRSQTVGVCDDSIRGEQTIAFTPTPEQPGLRVELSLAYEIRRRSPVLRGKPPVRPSATALDSNAVSSEAIQLAQLIREADSVVALTGAGISVPSGIPDFRTPGTGLWTNVDPMEVAHIDVFRRDPARFWHFFGDRFQALEHKRPNAAHAALARLELAGLLDGVITQNIDRLHARAGTSTLVEVHGTIDHSSCLVCRASYPLADVRDRQQRDGAGVPRCACGQPLKPDVVLFGEYLPVEAVARAEQLAAGADLLVCIGSSLEVYPIGQLPAVTLAAGGDVAIVTQGATPFDGRAAVRCSEDVVHELEAVLDALEPELASVDPAPSGTGEESRG